ncbi:ComEA family DNA-binding protein [Microbacterium sp. W1N]|uniref:ComEA family DNA-binding protein n=1 Tax=Microbacterium festucae TaxID=2977531 RepID=UPI0021BF5FA5|nr:ComEA family DNA-binding protein [Microbacterium festucae]MCT9820153.1 ComEA family DNA-binding protein [Microbacterium festucae]
MTAGDGQRRRRLGLGAAIVLVIAIAAVTVGIGVVRTVAAPAASVPRPTAATTTADAGVTPAALYVHVAGAVAAPGLYRLDAGTRVVDAIGAAGGLAPDADPAAVNLARPLSDGEQLIVPRVGDVPAAGAGGASDTGGNAGGVGPDGKIDLNTADATALETLPRIGPALAERILQWREQNGRFTSVDDLLSVPGIGDKMLAGLRDLVRV